MKKPDNVNLERVINSKEISDVFFRIVKGSDYTSKICKEKNKGLGTISMQIRDLLDSGLIKKGKRTRIQYYEPNWDGIMKLFRDYKMKIVEPKPTIRDAFNRMNLKNYKREMEWNLLNP